MVDIVHSSTWYTGVRMQFGACHGPALVGRPRGWAGRDRPISFSYDGPGPTPAHQFSSDGPQPGLARQRVRGRAAARPGPSHTRHFTAQPGPAHHFSNVSARSGLAHEIGSEAYEIPALYGPAGHLCGPTYGFGGPPSNALSRTNVFFRLF